MTKNRLKLNGDKTELLVLRSPRLQQGVLSNISIADLEVQASPSARCLGSTFDQAMKMDIQVQNICRTCII